MIIFSIVTGTRSRMDRPFPRTGALPDSDRLRPDIGRLRCGPRQNPLLIDWMWVSFAHAEIIGGGGISPPRAGASQQLDQFE